MAKTEGKFLEEWCKELDQVVPYIATRVEPVVPRVYDAAPLSGEDKIALALRDALQRH